MQRGVKEMGLRWGARASGYFKIPTWNSRFHCPNRLTRLDWASTTNIGPKFLAVWDLWVAKAVLRNRTMLGVVATLNEFLKD